MSKSHAYETVECSRFNASSGKGCNISQPNCIARYDPELSGLLVDGGLFSILLLTTFLSINNQTLYYNPVKTSCSTEKEKYFQKYVNLTMKNIVYYFVT